MIRRPPRSTLFPYTDALPILGGGIKLGLRIDFAQVQRVEIGGEMAAHAVGADHHQRAHRIDRKSTRLNSSHSQISYAVFCLKKKKMKKRRINIVAVTSYTKPA